MREILLMLAILAGWFVLNKWVLPKFGVSTWLSGACAVDPHSDPQPRSNETETESQSDSSDLNANARSVPSHPVEGNLSEVESMPSPDSQKAIRQSSEAKSSEVREE